MSDFEWDIGLGLLSVVDADGFEGTQPDAYGEEKSGVVPYERHHWYGFTSRPLDAVFDPHGTPDPTQAVQLLWAHEGGKSHSWPMEDPRIVKILPSLQSGESMQYGASGNFVRCHTDGSVTVMTTDQGGAPAGNAVFLRVRPNELCFHAPWGKLVFDATGFHITTQAGARFSLGTVGGLPQPFAAIGSYANVQAGAVTLNGQVVACGPSGGTADNAAQSTPLLAYLAQMTEAMLQIAEAMGTFTGVGTFPALPIALQSIAALATPPPIQSSTTVA